MVNTKTIIKPSFQAAYFIKHIIFTLIRARRSHQQGDSTAHNQMNFGNYLWGATGYTVNFGYGGLQIGAHLNSRFNSRRNGYTPQWDSKDDQRSIVLGAHHAAKNNYRAKKK
ncbi:hypothetical protein CMU32_12405 [Elizabethkingia anophelis]|nr:hypothetical protein [Elizabethkingia anophelis]